jgi:hypothetical protein
MASTQSQYQVQGGFLLDVIIAQGATVFQLLSRKDQALLIWWDSLLVLNLRLDIVNGIGRLDIQRDGLARQSLYKNLRVGISKEKTSIREIANTVDPRNN